MSIKNTSELTYICHPFANRAAPGNPRGPLICIELNGLRGNIYFTYTHIEREYYFKN